MPHPKMLLLQMLMMTPLLLIAQVCQSQITWDAGPTYAIDTSGDPLCACPLLKLPMAMAVAVVCLFSAQYLKKPMHVESPNLTWKCFTMSAGTPFIFGSKGERSRSWVAKTLLACVFTPLWVLASSGSVVCLPYVHGHSRHSVHRANWVVF